jgi:hypothetical protein
LCVLLRKCRVSFNVMRLSYTAHFCWWWFCELNYLKSKILLKEGHNWGGVGDGCYSYNRKMESYL